MIPCEPAVSLAAAYLFTRSAADSVSLLPFWPVDGDDDTPPLECSTPGWEAKVVPGSLCLGYSVALLEISRDLFASALTLSAALSGVYCFAVSVASLEVRDALFAATSVRDGLPLVVPLVFPLEYPPLPSGSVLPMFRFALAEADWRVLEALSTALAPVCGRVLTVSAADPETLEAVSRARVAWSAAVCFPA